MSWWVMFQWQHLCSCVIFSLTDNLPVATKYVIDKKIHYESGYRLGYVNHGKVSVNWASTSLITVIIITFQKWSSSMKLSGIVWKLCVKALLSLSSYLQVLTSTMMCVRYFIHDFWLSWSSLAAIVLVDLCGLVQSKHVNVCYISTYTDPGGWAVYRLSGWSVLWMSSVLAVDISFYGYSRRQEALHPLMDGWSLGALTKEWSPGDENSCNCSQRHYRRGCTFA